MAIREKLGPSWSAQSMCVTFWVIQRLPGTLQGEGKHRGRVLGLDKLGYALGAAAPSIGLRGSVSVVCCLYAGAVGQQGSAPTSSTALIRAVRGWELEWGEKIYSKKYNGIHVLEDLVTYKSIIALDPKRHIRAKSKIYNIRSKNIRKYLKKKYKILK